MENNSHYTAAGAFVIIFVAVTVLLIIWLSSGFSFTQYKIYKVYMQESVSGLNVQSPVEYNGVEVGSVKSIELDHKNPQLVELLLDIKESTPITVGTVATLQTRGVTGITFMALKDKSDNLTPLKVHKGDRYPIIKTAPSLFTRLDTALNKLTDNLHDVSVAIQKLLDKQNRKSMKEILINLRRITHTLAINDKKMTNILSNMSKASDQLTPMMTSTTGAMRMLQMQTLPATYQVMNNMNKITRSFSELASEIQQNPSIMIRGIERKSTGPGER